MRRRLLSAAILILAAAPARAEIKDGNSLYRYCDATIGAFVMYCFGYLDSVVNDMRSYGSVDGFAACLPPTMDDGKRRNIVVAFLERHPRERPSDATKLIAQAFSEAYPCGVELGN